MRARKWLAGCVKTGQEFPEEFIRVHQSFIINKIHIQGLDEASLWEQLVSASEADAVEPLDWSY